MFASKPKKKQEKVQPYHSWNANFSVTNAVTFRLQRHSDHHAHGEGVSFVEFLEKKRERERERERRRKNKKNSPFFVPSLFSSPSHQTFPPSKTAEKSFETLRDEPDAPQLPASYPVMMVTAVAFPALFRRVMEPRARAEQAKNEARRMGRVESKGGEGAGVVVR